MSLTLFSTQRDPDEAEVKDLLIGSMRLAAYHRGRVDGAVLERARIVACAKQAAIVARASGCYAAGDVLDTFAIGLAEAASVSRRGA